MMKKISAAILGRSVTGSMPEAAAPIPGGHPPRITPDRALKIFKGKIGNFIFCAVLLCFSPKLHAAQGAGHALIKHPPVRPFAYFVTIPTSAPVIPTGRPNRNRGENMAEKYRLFDDTNGTTTPWDGNLKVWWRAGTHHDLPAGVNTGVGMPNPPPQYESWDYPYYQHGGPGYQTFLEAPIIRQTTCSMAIAPKVGGVPPVAIGQLVSVIDLIVGPPPGLPNPWQHQSNTGTGGSIIIDIGTAQEETVTYTDTVRNQSTTLSGFFTPVTLTSPPTPQRVLVTDTFGFHAQSPGVINVERGVAGQEEIQVDFEVVNSPLNGAIDIEPNINPAFGATTYGTPECQNIPVNSTADFPATGGIIIDNIAYPYTAAATTLAVAVTAPPNNSDLGKEISVVDASAFPPEGGYFYLNRGVSNEDLIHYQSYSTTLSLLGVVGGDITVNSPAGNPNDYRKLPLSGGTIWIDIAGGKDVVTGSAQTANAMKFSYTSRTPSAGIGAGPPFIISGLRQMGAGPPFTAPGAGTVGLNFAFPAGSIVSFGKDGNTFMNCEESGTSTFQNDHPTIGETVWFGVTSSRIMNVLMNTTGGHTDTTPVYSQNALMCPPKTGGPFSTSLRIPHGVGSTVNFEGGFDGCIVTKQHNVGATVYTSDPRTITVNDASQFPASGTLILDLGNQVSGFKEELIPYTSKTVAPATFTVSMTAVQNAHLNGAVVTAVDAAGPQRTLDADEEFGDYYVNPEVWENNWARPWLSAGHIDPQVPPANGAAVPSWVSTRSMRVWVRQPFRGSFTQRANYQLYPPR